MTLVVWTGLAVMAFFLPEGSRAMETGGTKGLRVATTPQDLRAALSDRLGRRRTQPRRKDALAEPPAGREGRRLAALAS